MARNRMKGFTLIETLLVLVIISAILYMGMTYFQQKATQMRIDRTTLQMQQILNAGLSYYVANGQWPVNAGSTVDITTTPANLLQANGYLPSGVTISSPWSGTDYVIFTDAKSRLFTVFTRVVSSGVVAGAAPSVAKIIAGTLPLAYTSSAPPPTPMAACAAASTSCYVVASINIPGQNLNNATAVNFAGVYRHGGCIPVPTCPVDASGNTMTAQVQVVPSSVSGLNDPNTSNTYPISSFTAYAKGPAANPPACADSASPPPPCSTSPLQGPPPASGQYWRACLQVVTEKGNVQTTNTSTGNAATDYGSNVSLMAITRCSINNETSGSQFTVYGN